MLGYRLAMASVQEVEMLRRQLDELTAQMIEVRQQSSSSSVGTRGSRENYGAWESESQSRTHLGKTLTTGISHSTDTRVRSILPILPCWKQRDNHQQWWWRLHHTNSSLQHCCTSSRCSHRREHGKWWEKLETTDSKLADNCAWWSGRQHGIIRASHDLQVWFQDWRRGRPSERISGTGETIRWGERYRSRSRSGEKKRALFRTRPSLWRHIFSWMWVNWETSTHCAWRLKITWAAEASSRRLQPEAHTTKIQWKSMQSPEKGKAKRNPARARRVVRKEKKSTQAKVLEKR